MLYIDISMYLLFSTNYAVAMWYVLSVHDLLEEEPFAHGTVPFQKSIAVVVDVHLPIAWDDGSMHL